MSRFICVLLSLVVVTVVLGSRRAAAMCGSLPTAGFSPPSLTTIPSEARIYLFVATSQSRGELEVMNAKYESRQVAESQGVITYEVRLRVSTGTRVALRWRASSAPSTSSTSSARQRRQARSSRR